MLLFLNNILVRCHSNVVIPCDLLNWHGLGPDSDVQLPHVASLEMNGVSDKQKTTYFTFQRGTVQVRSWESAQNINEKDVPQRVVGKFKAHVYNTIQYNTIVYSHFYFYTSIQWRKIRLWQQLNLIAKACFSCCVLVILKSDLNKLIARFDLKISGYSIPLLHVVVPQQHPRTLP